MIKYIDRTVGKQLKHTSNPFDIVKLFMNGFVLTTYWTGECPAAVIPVKSDRVLPDKLAKALDTGLTEQSRCFGPNIDDEELYTSEDPT
ncbi:hypothetical protein KQX54_017406 [Cotesia glomerata]|uniref:Uncharacterized protein n=1 Tax=Cotesia glomerata TaxID=32391 RepID=A0AAV7HV37_COTGL|nr:hypothetical protein KQX54_017406 [Cotesia glomerata]